MKLSCKIRKPYTPRENVKIYLQAVKQFHSMSYFVLNYDVSISYIN